MCAGTRSPECAVATALAATLGWPDMSVGAIAGLGVDAHSGPAPGEGPSHQWRQEETSVEEVLNPS